MKPALPFVARQSGWLAFFFLLFAVQNGWYVAEGLWQGSGLHGYTDNMNNKYGFFIVWTWDAFIRMLVFSGLACAALGLKVWQMVKAGRIGIRGKGHALKRTANQRRR